MPTSLTEPSEQNGYLFQHAARLLDSLRHWTGRELIAPELPSQDRAHALFHAPFVVLSHNAAAEPTLNYANRAGMRLFELTWEELIALPSRLTAEPLHQNERRACLPAWRIEALSMITAAFASPRAAGALSLNKPRYGIWSTRAARPAARRRRSATGSSWIKTFDFSLAQG